MNVGPNEIADCTSKILATLKVLLSQSDHLADHLPIEHEAVLLVYFLYNGHDLICGAFLIVVSHRFRQVAELYRLAVRIVLLCILIDQANYREYLTHRRQRVPSVVTLEAAVDLA